MKKRNKKSLQEKDYLRLQKELSKNYKAQRDLGYIELDEPIHNGYNAVLCLRSDIANREDAWIFQGTIDHFGNSCFAKKEEEFTFLSSKPNITRHKKYPFVLHNKPHIREISVREYESIVAQAQKWFVRRPAISAWSGDTYKCIIPNFFFDIKIEKNYITKVRVFDEILDQEEAELKDEVKRNHYYKYYSWRKAPKGFRKGLNKTQRAKAKQVLYKIISTGDDFVFEDCYKGADWLYW